MSVITLTQRETFDYISKISFIASTQLSCNLKIMRPFFKPDLSNIFRHLHTVSEQITLVYLLAFTFC